MVSHKMYGFYWATLYIEQKSRYADVQKCRCYICSTWHAHSVSKMLDAEWEIQVNSNSCSIDKKDKKAVLLQRCPRDAQSDNFDRFTQSDNTHMVCC